MEALTKAGLIQFVEMITSKGWINPNTGGGWKAAVTKILGDTPADEDVHKIDVETSIRRYNNLHPGELSPASLLQYEKRIKQAIEQYKNYVAEPTKYKAPARPLSAAPKRPEKNGKAKVEKLPITEVTVIENDVPPAPHPQQHHVPAMRSLATEANLVLPFPLRPDYLAQIVIPRDMTKDEAGRLCAFIQALAI